MFADADPEIFFARRPITERASNAWTRRTDVFFVPEIPVENGGTGYAVQKRCHTRLLSAHGAKRVKAGVVWSREVAGTGSSLPDNLCALRFQVSVSLR